MVTLLMIALAVNGGMYLGTILFSAYKASISDRAFYMICRLREYGI